MTLILNAEDVAKAITTEGVIEALEESLRHESDPATVVTPRLTADGSAGTFLRLMGAILGAQGVMGFKVFNGGADGVRYAVALYDLASGEQLALMDAAGLTAARTGATTAVATKHMARADSAEVAVLGAGWEARTNLRSICAVRPVRRVAVFSPNPANRERFAREMTAELGFEVAAVDDPQRCVEGADIVLAATNTKRSATGLALMEKWLPDGVHVNTIGSTMRHTREVDHEVLSRADVLVMDDPAQSAEDSADVAVAVEHGLDVSTVASLADVVSGTARGRLAERDRTVFKSVGTALQDVSAAHHVYGVALAAGLGQRLRYMEAKPVALRPATKR